jgi:hypothetical protein
VFEKAVLGGGPVGLITAIELSKYSKTVLVTQRVPDASSAPRLEAVPAAFINLLIELGVHPRRIGVDRLHDTRYLAWEQREPRVTNGPPAAYVERPALDFELFALVRRHKWLTTVIETKKPLFEGEWWRGQGWRARVLFDATGRRAILASQRSRLPKPWIARTFWTMHAARPMDRTLRIAALPFGYAYRLSSARYDTLGVVGRGRYVGGAPGLLELGIKSNGGTWVLDGLPGLLSLNPGYVYPASVQWSRGAACIGVGDAALARDILSSQGLAAGVSEAFYAAAIRDVEDVRMFRSRQGEQREAHLGSLAKQIDTCEFRYTANWSEYAAFVQRHRASALLSRNVGLVAGRLVST